jgi:cobyric acid synthase CobQ
MGWIVSSLRPAKPGWIAPSYAGYSEVCAAADIEGKAYFVAQASDNFSVRLDAFSSCEADMLFIGNPNNPTGAVTDSRQIIDLARADTRRWIVVDESFMDFLPDAPERTLIRDGIPGNVIVVKSLTKYFAIPGLRLGMGCAAGAVMERIKKVRLPWSVNILAQKSAEHLYDEKEYINRTSRVVTELRGRLEEGLSRLPGFRVYPSAVNFMLIGLPPAWPAPRLQAELLQRGILIRSCVNFEGLGSQYCRIAARPDGEITEFLQVMDEINGCGVRRREISFARTGHGISGRAKAIMVVGTMSGSGKSAVAAGLCRYFARLGRNVAPFKAQNMSLNSFVTEEGGEMGRAQVVQARASGLKPHTDMNPALLKPVGEAGSQVIVNGKAIGNFPAGDYYAIKARIRSAALAAYDRLASKHDLIIIEGAGSPAEINMLEDDFVNMAMAEYASASVILVADIDRGGVFAGIYGTVSLLPEKHRRLFSGIIINKFRGDKSLLESGIRQIEEKTGVPVLGILPYESSIRMEDEDSVCLENRAREKSPVVDIAVIRLPWISNFTDFFTLENVCGVAVRYVENPAQAGRPDLLVIPGSKNTRADLRFLRGSGWADALDAFRRDGIPVFGLCGGYQMLGRRVADPDGLEGEPGEERGLECLPVETVLAREKELAQVAGVTTARFPFAGEGLPFEGYEIHAGRTMIAGNAGAPLLITKRRTQAVSEPEGAVSEDGMVFGTYVHGLFDNAALRLRLLGWLCRRKGVEPPAGFGESDQPDPADTIANMLAAHVNMAAIRSW